MEGRVGEGSQSHEKSGLRIMDAGDSNEPDDTKDAPRRTAPSTMNHKSVFPELTGSTTEERSTTLSGL